MLFCKQLIVFLSVVFLAVVLLFIAPSGAEAQWCGENGLIRFSLATGDSIVPVAHQEPENGVTVVDLYAWLSDVVPVARDGEAFMATGGFELTLVVEGAEAVVMEKKVPCKHLDVGQSNEVCIVGLDPGMSIKNGRVNLVQWKVMFQGRPEDVVFRLATEPTHSCKTMPDCVTCQSRGLYIGVDGSGQLSMMFGVGCVPAYLNPNGETDLTPERGPCGFEEVGLFERR
ncbi:MAG: hypothetical protein KOO60_11815 [Gemmatimonadales bacterium]|nr:hypothetical protein [Gemmatimonadales bacterium]